METPDFHCTVSHSTFKNLTSSEQLFYSLSEEVQFMKSNSQNFSRNYQQNNNK